MQTHFDSTNATKTPLVSLITILEEVPDPRVTATVDHDLADLLTIALCTILCGGDSFYDMEEFGKVRPDWLKTFLRLRQRKVKNKSNEITAVPELLRALELAGCIVTADAMHCQKHIAKEIQEADAEYVLALKGNQGTAFAEVKSFLDEAIAREEKHLVTLKTVDKEHGRLEVRRHWQTEKLEWFADREQWEGLKSVGVVEARRTVNGRQSVERRYYLSSLGNDAGRFARAVRGHWGVENSRHWVLDVVFGEDESRARSGHAAENLAATRRLAINLLRRDKTCKRSIKGKLLRAAIDPDYLKRILNN